MSENDDIGELLRREEVAKEILRKVPSTLVGARLKRARQRMGLSIRDLAAAANVSKNSVVRLEQGAPAHTLTVLKLASALGIHVASLAKPEAEGRAMAVHRNEDDR